MRAFLFSFLCFNINLSVAIAQDTRIVIPVVIHVILNDTDPMISDSDIAAQIAVLNQDYNQRNIDLTRVPQLFIPDIANVGICFALATTNPDGQPTNGIIRKSTMEAFMGDLRSSNGDRSIKFDQLGGSDAWSPDRYLNVWIGGLQNSLADATFPVVAGEAEDGIVIDPRNFGIKESKDSEFGLGRVLTHEIGHYLGLEHLWGSSTGCDMSDDGLDDTPEQAAPYFECVTHPVISCGSADMFMNFMNFGPDSCLVMFSKDQASVIRRTLSNQRQDLISSSLIIENQIEPDISFAPSEISISFAAATQLISLSITDITGKRISNYTLSDKFPLTIDTNSWADGVYFLQFCSTNSCTTKKILIAN